MSRSFYTIIIVATIFQGCNPSSNVQNALTVPGAPIIGEVIAGNAQATINFTAPTTNGGSPITSYTISSNDGKSVSGSSSPITMTGLTNEVIYTFTVKANNKIGASAASTISNSVTPTAPIIPPSTPSTSEPSLEDLFSGKAVFQSISESELITLNFTTKLQGVWDQKLPIVFNPNDQMYYTFTRGALSASLFNIFVLKSSDGVSFNQVSAPIFNSENGDRTYYDAHLTLDTSVTPNRYIMTMECASISGVFGASVCISSSTTPWDSNSWSTPKLIVESNNVKGLKSASTGVSIVDNTGRTFLKWTLVNDKVHAPDPEGLRADEGNESTSSWFTQITNITTKLGKSGNVGQLMFGASENVYCNSSWDCNNIDVQDWKQFGSYFYAIYNGANYYRCVRPTEDRDVSSHWSIAIRRSTSALGSYNESSGPIIDSTRHDTCGISYPVINIVQNKTYLYYAYYPLVGGNKMMRSKLEWKTAAVSKIASTPQTPVFPESTYNPSVLIKRFYKILLLRSPSSAEVMSWENFVQQTSTNKAKNLALGFLNSVEFKNRWIKMTAAQKAITMHQSFLFRTPSAAEETSFSSMIQSSTDNYIFNVYLDSQEFSNNSLLIGGL